MMDRHTVSKFVAALVALLTVAVAVACDQLAATNEGLVSASFDSSATPPTPPRKFYEKNVVYHDEGAQFAFPIATPASQGLDEAKLERAASYLAKRPEPRSFLVIRNDSLVFERYFHDAGPNESRNVHSASKGIISALVGIAIERGDIERLDQPLVEIIPEMFPDPPGATKSKITIEHLLAMTAGLRWREDRTEFDIEGTPNWVKSILALDAISEPGAKFHYSTGLTHLASAALTQATGKSTREYAEEHLFGPMGITPERWGQDPQGVDSGGCNVFLTPRELAQFGLLYLNRGRWMEQQLVPADWVDTSFEKRNRLDSIAGYGLGWWVFRGQGHDFALAWGWGGQFVYVFPELDACIVVTTDTLNEPRAIEPWPFYTKYLKPAFLP